MGPLYLGKMGTFVNFRYINNLASDVYFFQFHFCRLTANTLYFDDF